MLLILTYRWKQKPMSIELVVPPVRVQRERHSHFMEKTRRTNLKVLRSYSANQYQKKKPPNYQKWKIKPERMNFRIEADPSREDFQGNRIRIILHPPKIDREIDPGTDIKYNQIDRVNELSFSLRICPPFLFYIL